MKLAPSLVHAISFYLGFFLFSYSLMLVFFLPGSQFYSSFVLGVLLIFDYLDFRLTGKSILSYFYNHQHRFLFYIFFLVAFIFMFTIDYLWGVKVIKMWEWVNYGFVEFFRMFLVMNVSFLLGVYEIFRVIQALLKKVVEERNIFPFFIKPRYKATFYFLVLFLGIVFLLLPAYVLVLGTNRFGEYIMLFPFISISLICSSITYLTGGEPVLEGLARINTVQVSAFILTAVISVLVTETLNSFNHEWRYLKVPLPEVQLLSIPLVIFIGWLPLAAGAISLVNLVKHLYYLNQKYSAKV